RPRRRPRVPHERRRVQRRADPHVDRLQARERGRRRSASSASRRVRAVLRLLATALEMVVRDLRPDDWTEVAAIYHDGMRDGMATFETEVPSWDDWHTSHPLRLVAEIDERVIGWAALAPVSSRWAYRGVAESSVYVSRDAQRKGVGRTLMQELIARSERA